MVGQPFFANDLQSSYRLKLIFSNVITSEKSNLCISFHSCSLSRLYCDYVVHVIP